MDILGRSLTTGERVRVKTSHPWMPDRQGVIKCVHNKMGNRFIVRFEGYELGMWHDEDGDPVLQLGEKDLVLMHEALSLAAAA